MLPHRLAHRAGTLAVDNSDGLQLGQHGVVQKAVQRRHGLIGHHPPQIHLRRGAHGAQLALRPVDDPLGLLFAAVLLGNPDLVLLGGDLQDTRLELKASILVDGQYLGLGAAHLHQLHRISRFGGPGGRRRRLLRPGAQGVLRLVEPLAQPCPLLVHLLPVLFLPLAAAHLVELLEHAVGGVPGLIQNGPCLRLGLLHRLGPLLLQLVPVLPGRTGGILHLPAQLPGLLLLLLHLLALLLQTGDHVLKADVFRVNTGGGLVDDLPGQAQPLGDGEGVGLAGDADEEPVGGGQGVDVKLTGGVLHPGGGHGVHLQLGVVSGGGHQGPQLPGLLDDGGSQGRALDGVGARAQLIEEDEGLVVRLLQNAHNVHHVGREGGEALGDGLLVADIGQYAVENHHCAVVRHRNVESTLGHQSQQTDGLQGDGLAAGVGAGDDQGIKIPAQVQVVGHRLVGVQQGMAGLPQTDATADDFGLAGPHPVGQLGPGEDHVQHDKQVVVLGDVLLVGGAVGGQLGQDPVNLLLLVGLELPQLVVGLHHPHGFDEEGSAGGGHVVDQAGHVVLALGAHGHHIPVGAHGDNGLLEILCLGG